MSGDGLKDVTNNVDKPYQSSARSAMAEVRRNNLSLRNSLQAMRNGVGLLQSEIAERKRAREEEREAKAIHSSSDQKHTKTEGLAQNFAMLSPK